MKAAVLDTPLIELALLSIALSMDAVAVAAARGLAANTVRLRDALVVAMLFGAAQAAMPLAGWFIGARAGPYVAAVDHWIAFGLLTLLGAKMIIEARRPPEVAEPLRSPFALRALVVLSIATSVDALVAGFTLPLLGFSPWLSAASIGAVTAVFSFAGVYVGRRLGAAFGPKLEQVGGILLVALGAKTLLEHLVAG